MKITNLASGSKGNATIIKTPQSCILIDDGIPLKTLENKLEELNMKCMDIKYMLFTHEHSDHIAGVKTFIKHHSPKLIMTKGTYTGLTYVDKTKVKFVKYMDEIILDDIKIKVIQTSHDSKEPCGYKVTHNNNTFVYITDTGYFKEELFQEIKNADAYLFEFNHCPEMLLNCDRPWFIKQRILSNKGHLSNEDASYIMSKVIGENTRHILLSHISQEANDYEVAKNTLIDLLDEYKIDYSNISILPTHQNSISETIDLTHTNKSIFVCEVHLEDAIENIIDNNGLPIIEKYVESVTCEFCKENAIYNIISTNNEYEEE